MSVGSVIRTLIGLALGIACVVVGFRMVSPPAREHHDGTDLGAVGEASAALLGLPILLFGVLVLCGVLGYRYASWRVGSEERARATPPAAELPEARVHGRLPGDKNETPGGGDSTA